MATDESSQGAALGPEISELEGDSPRAGAAVPDLQDVRGDFLSALCVLEMVCLALEGKVEEPPEDIGSFALALRHGVELTNAVYERFDLGLVGLTELEPDGVLGDAGERTGEGEPTRESDVTENHASCEAAIAEQVVRLGREFDALLRELIAYLRSQGNRGEIGAHLPIARFERIDPT